MRIHPASLKLFEAAFGTTLRRGRNEQLHVGVRSDHGADIPAVENRAASLTCEIPLPLQQCRAYRRVSRDNRCDLGHGLASQFRIVGVEAKLVARAQRLELACRIPTPAPQVQRNGAIEQSRIHVRQAEISGEGARDGPLAARRGTVDRDHRPLLSCVRQSHVPRWRRAALTGAYPYGKARRRTRWRTMRQTIFYWS